MQDAELKVASILLSCPAEFDQVAYLRPGDFSDYRLGLIFGALSELIQEGKAVNPLSVADRLTSQGKLEEAGGPGFISSLVGVSGEVESLAYYADYIRNTFRRKCALVSLQVAMEDLMTCSIEQTDDVLFELQGRVERVVSDDIPAPEPGPAEAWAANLKALLERTSGEPDGIPTGMKELDLLLKGGWKPGNLVILAGRPGTGKSSLALQWALHAASMGKPTGFLSLEMSAFEVRERAIAQWSGEELGPLSPSPTPNWGEITEAVNQLAKLPLRITDRSVSTVEEVLLRARGLRREMKGLALLVVDYLQLMTTIGRREETREREVAEVSRALKRLACDLGIPVIALSQLNRQPENRKDGEVRPADLRESGALEQDADLVLAVNRPAHYSPDEYEDNYVKLKLLKNRNGPAFVHVELEFIGRLFRFEPWRGSAGGRKAKPAETIPLPKKGGRKGWKETL